MAKQASVKELLEVLAKERGLDLKETKKEKVSGSGVIGKLEAGAGFGEAFTETAKEKFQSAKEAVTTTKGIKSLGKKAYGEMFKGDDIFSAYMRGRLKKSESKDEKESVGGESSAGAALGPDSTAHLAIIAKQSMALQGMARDTNVLRQNLQQLVKIWGGTAATKKEKTEEEKKQEESLEAESQTERTKDVDYFAEQDKKEAEQEAARAKSPTPAGETKEAPQKEGGGNLLDIIMSLFSSGFLKAIRSLFNPKMLMGIFKKIFLPAAIIGTLFSGIMDGFKKYKETGSLTEAITAGLGGMLSFLTFGIFGEDTIKKLFESVSNFFSPILDTISGIFKGVKDFFVGLFGGQVKVEDKAPAPPKAVTPEPPKAPAGTPGAPGAPGATGAPGAAGATGAPAVAAAGGLAGAPTTAPPLAEGPPKPPKPTPVPVAATPPSTAPTKAPADGGESKRNESAKKFQETQQARADVEALQMAEADLQGLHKEWRDEKGAVMEKLVSDTKKYPDGVDDDPKSPNYPKELKEIDEKYKKWIGIKKSEIENLKKKPGVKEELKRQKYEESRLDELDRMNDIGAPKKTPSKAAGTKFTTTEKVEVTQTTGGGETTRSLARTPEAKKAEEELKGLEKKHSEERKEAVAKAKSEGKITGRFATSKDFEEVGELKALKTKQEAERAELIKKISEGTSVQTTTSGGAAGGGSVSSGAGGTAPATSVSGGGASGAISSGGGAGGGASGAISSGGAAPAAGQVSASGGGAAPAPSVSPTPEVSPTPATSMPSGTTLAKSSTEIAEEQRMESAADQGSVINAPTNNNSRQTADKGKRKTSDVYDSDLISRLATT